MLQGMNPNLSNLLYSNKESTKLSASQLGERPTTANKDNGTKPFPKSSPEAKPVRKGANVEAVISKLTGGFDLGKFIRSVDPNVAEEQKQKVK